MQQGLMLDLAPQRLHFRYQSVDACFQTAIAGMPAGPFAARVTLVAIGHMTTRFVSSEMMLAGVMSRRVSAESVSVRTVPMTVADLVARMAMTAVVLSHRMVHRAPSMPFVMGVLMPPMTMVAATGVLAPVGMVWRVPADASGATLAMMTSTAVCNVPVAVVHLSLMHVAVSVLFFLGRWHALPVPDVTGVLPLEMSAWARVMTAGAAGVLAPFRCAAAGFGAIKPTTTRAATG